MYDGLHRERVWRESTWSGSAWKLTNEVHNLFVGAQVIQERNANNVPQVAYTLAQGRLARTDVPLMLNSPSYGAQVENPICRGPLPRHEPGQEELATKPKTDRRKTRIAVRLRRETTLTLAWIARRLQMGSVNTLKNTLRLAKSRD